MTLDRIHISQSLRKAKRRFTIKVNTAFAAVVEACAIRKEGDYLWLISEIREAAIRLNELGWAHSVETWTMATEEGPATLVGGLYGVAIGGLFCGESMFNHKPDASKVAFAALTELLRDDGRNGEGRLIDVQLRSPHMAALGAFEVPREEYMAHLEQALALPLSSGFNTKA